MGKTINELKDDTFDGKALILEQVQGFKRRVKDAIISRSAGLAPSLAVEYLGLIAGAMGSTGSNQHLFHNLLLLKTEVRLYPQKVPKDDPLLQLRWLDNAISKLEIIANQLPPVTPPLSQMGLHTKVVEVAGKLLDDGHYAQAVFEAFKALEEYVRDKTTVHDKYGKNLMAHVLNENNPILKIKPSHPQTSNEEQEGFRLIFMGSMLAIKNPKSHRTLKLRDKSRALLYLAFASLLFELVDDATVDTNTSLS